MINKKSIEKILQTIPDPELNISLWDLGLIYEVKLDQSKGIVTITMTLTSIGCPLFELIATLIKTELKKISGVKNVVLELTFDPPWNIDRMTKKGKELLGMI